MVILKRITFLYFFFIAIYGCSSQNRKEEKAYRNLILQGKYEEALSFLNQSELAKEPKNLLLILMERGRLYQLAQNTTASIEQYDLALQKARELYTESISNKILRATLNEQQDIYYGLPYEVSQLHSLQIINYLQMWAQDQDSRAKQNWLMKARAMALQWDSFLKTLKAELLGESYFKDDLSAKILSAYVHLQVGTSADRQTALLLYREAWELLFKNYNLYKTYNGAHSEFRKKFSDLPKMEKPEVEKNFVRPTQEQNLLKGYLLRKIISLTKLLRPQEIKVLPSQLGVSNQEISTIGKFEKNSNTVLALVGIIPEKIPQKYEYSLESAFNSTNDAGLKSLIANVGVPLLAHFAAEILGLYPKNYSAPGMIGSVYGSRAVVSIATIGFELPKLSSPYRSENYVMVKKNTSDTQSVAAINILPLNDLAEEAVEENSASLYTRVGLRLAGKHLLAIASAYAAYKAAGESLTAKWAAVAAYALSTQGIKASETADTRYWSSLPSSIWISEIPQTSSTSPAMFQIKHGDGMELLNFQLDQGREFYPFSLPST